MEKITIPVTINLQNPKNNNRNVNNKIFDVIAHLDLSNLFTISKPVVFDLQLTQHSKNRAITFYLEDILKNRLIEGDYVTRAKVKSLDFEYSYHKDSMEEYITHINKVLYFNYDYFNKSE